jgi:hypothetical protein
VKNGKSADNKHLRELISVTLREKGEITVGQVSELVRPFFIFDYEKSYTSELRRKVRRLMSSFKDGDGVRVCFSDDSGLYINVDTTNDLQALTNVKRQLMRKFDGTKRSLKKVRRREQALIDGQMALSDLVKTD